MTIIQDAGQPAAPRIDLNADLGEGGPADGQLMPMISSANISCGAHAGDEHCIRQAIRQALLDGVVIGAHPSYPDRDNYGRKSLSIDADSLRGSLLQQLAWLQGVVFSEGGQLHHIKPHGALYNDAARDPILAELLVSVAREFDPTLILVGLAGSRLLDAGRAADLQVAGEAFVDRRYRADASLVPRQQAGAVIHEPKQAIAQAMNIICHRQVTSIDGPAVDIRADTLCIHGDTPGAVAFASQLNQALAEAGINVGPIARLPAR